MDINTQTAQPLFPSLNRPANLPDEIAHQLRGRILSREFVPGQRLPTEQGLAEMFGVSRNVVREAIARLKLSGYVDTRRGVGSFVADEAGVQHFQVDSEDLLHYEALNQVYQLRVEIEAGAAALAARHRTQVQLEDLHAALLRVDESTDDWIRGAERALDFHTAVAYATNNPYFIRLMGHFRHVIGDATRTLRFRSSGTDRTTEIEREHHEIFDAIAAGDSDAARQAMRVHLSNGMQRHREFLRGAL